MNLPTLVHLHFRCVIPILFFVAAWTVFFKGVCGAARSAQPNGQVSVKTDFCCAQNDEESFDDLLSPLEETPVPETITVDEVVKRVREGGVTDEVLMGMAFGLSRQKLDRAALAQIIPLLEGDEGIEVKRRAIKVLGFLHDGHLAAPDIAPLLDHQNEEIQRAALFSLSLMDSPFFPQPIIGASAEVLKGGRIEQPELRKAVIQLLQKLRAEPPELERALAAVLEHDEIALRNAAITALAAIELQLPATPNAVAKALQDYVSGEAVVHAAIILLDHPNHKQLAITTFTEALNYEFDNNFRKWAVQKLGECGERGKDLAPELVKMLKTEPDVNVKRQVVKALFEVKADAQVAVPALAGALGDSNEFVREAALETLAKFGGAAAPAADAIIRALRDDDKFVRQSAVTTMEAIGAKADDRTRMAFIDALVSFGKVQPESNAEQWIRSIGIIAVRSDNVEVRQRALEVVASALKSTNRDLCRAALAWALAIQPESHGLIPEIARRISNEEEDISVRADFIAKLCLYSRAAKPALPVLIAACNDREPIIQQTALEGLVWLDDSAEEALPVLHRIMADTERDKSLRALAAEAIARIDPKDRRSVEYLANALDANDDDITIQFRLYAISQLDSRAHIAVPRILLLLQHTKPIKRDESETVIDLAEPLERTLATIAAYYLGDILADAPADETVETTVNALIVLLSDENMNNRYEAVKALRRIGPAAKDAVPALRAALKDSTARVRVGSAFALWRLGEPAEPLVELLSNALSDPECPTRCKLSALEAIEAMRTDAKGAIPAIAPLLADENSSVRYQAAVALSVTGNDTAATLSLLNGLLHDESESVRMYAANALLAMGNDAAAALPALNGLLHDENEHMRMYAAAAILSISGESTNAWPVLQEALDGGYQNDAINALKRVGPKAKVAFPALTKIAKNQNFWRWPYRCQAIIALNAIDPQAAEPILRELVNDDNVAVSREARKTLGMAQK